MSKDVNIQQDLVDDFTHGASVHGTSALIAVPALVKAPIKGIQFKANASNAGTVYVGKIGVTADTTAATSGIPLAAGEGLFLPVKDHTLVYAIASEATQYLHWLIV